VADCIQTQWSGLLWPLIVRLTEIVIGLLSYLMEMFVSLRCFIDTLVSICRYPGCLGRLLFFDICLTHITESRYILMHCYIEYFLPCDDML